MWVTKLLISPVKKKDFCPKMTKFCPKLEFLFIAGSFGALLVGWLVVVARGLYLARHLFTLFTIFLEQIVFLIFYIFAIVMKFLNRSLNFWLAL